MKILIGTHHLLSFAGTETFTLTLANRLTQDHQVAVYSKYISPKLLAAFNRKVMIINNLDHLMDINFDVAHVHHGITAIEIRHQFPDLPIFYLSHESSVYLEEPPPLDLNITYYGAVNKITYNHLLSINIPKTKIRLVLNTIDEEIFKAKTNPRPKIHKALILSNKISRNVLKIIEKACGLQNISLTYIGKKFGEVNYFSLPKIIRAHDLIFTLGRGVIESLFCNRQPFILDVHGGDGLLTSKSFKISESKGFSGKVFAKKYTPVSLVNEIVLYDPAETVRLRKIALDHYSAKSSLPKLVRLYHETKKSYRYHSINNSQITTLQRYILETKLYSSLSCCFLSQRDINRHERYMLKRLVMTKLGFNPIKKIMRRLFK